MGNYEQLKAAIAAAIKSNGNQEITGAILQSILLSMVNAVGSGAVFRGVATPSTNPGNRDENCFYLAGTAGTYSNFGGFVLNEGLAVLQNTNGSWSGTKILSIALKADTDNIGGSHHLKYNQAAMINLYNVEPISACTENNKLWFKTDGHLYYRQAGTDYDLGTPAYLLYYNGTKIYKYNGTGFTEMSSGGGEPVNLDFKTGESVEDISLFGSRASIDNKTDAQLALMMPTGAVIKALFDAIDSIDTSGGTYDGIDQVVTFSFVASTRILTLKQSGRTAKTITLPLASTSSPGLMSAQDKTDIANLKSGKANLAGANGNLILSSSEWPRSIIRNVAYEGFDYSSLEVGDIYYDESLTAPYKRLYYKATFEGNPIDLGLPQERVLYYCEMTQKFYKFVANSQKTDGSFVEVSQAGGGSISVVDDLDTGGSSVPLSAEQGKNLKIALESLRTALANLAYTGTAPEFPWDEEDVPEGDISNYVQDGLVFHLDGIDKGNVADQWTDLIGGVAFPNHGATALDNCWQLGGGSQYLGVSQQTGADLTFSPQNCTIEVVYQQNRSISSDPSMSIHLGKQNSNILACIYVNPNVSGWINGVYVDGSGTQNQDGTWTNGNVYAFPQAKASDNLPHTISLNKTRAIADGTPLSSLGANHWSGNGGGRYIGCASSYSGSNVPTPQYFAKGKVYAVRIYNRILTEAEMRQNQRVDNVRFELGLTLPE